VVFMLCTSLLYVSVLLVFVRDNRVVLDPDLFALCPILYPVGPILDIEDVDVLYE